ncbi:MAG: hypothetical protein KME50_15630 [Nostoc desertorum CM1-VF14]|jgi:hypothetical protein|nr:hypothetical protein [Nostoc desertorum CM1-VF14]
MQDLSIIDKEFLPPASCLTSILRLRPKRSYAAGFTAALSAFCLKTISFVLHADGNRYI